MIGIYKITNNINGHCYIGQSRCIEKRWNNHKSSNLDYPLYRAFRKYGLENFTFEVIEECSISELNEKENYWIDQYQPEYNQTIGGDYQVIPQKLTFEEVQIIQQLLIQDVNGQLSHKELAERYNVHPDTIRDINVGRTWFDEKLTYPLHLSKYDSRRDNTNYCIDCGKVIFKTSVRCPQCEGKHQREINLKEREKFISREELKNLIRTMPFTKIGTLYGVTDNAIRKWCDNYNLPRKKTEINSYSDEEWNLI